MGIHAPSAARIITQIGQRTDVYVGCAPRIRRSGGREDIAPTALLWADCDAPDVVAALHAFPFAPSVILRSGTATNAHGFWALTSALALTELEDANRRLALALGADPKCVDGARILRVPGTFNFKNDTRRPVRLFRYTAARYRPSEILPALPPVPAAPAIICGRDAPRSLPRTNDPLLSIAPADYVRVLTRREPGRDHKIACPLHSEKKPSFHVYSTAERGWACFGCPTPTGRPLGGDIYTLASQLWGIPTSGRDFIELRDRLDDLFGVRRG
jgi:CHC2 zinc finger/RepB DNA-primase N-terminal domain